VNLRQLEIIRAVMRTRSTVAAAQDLGMSQPAVSNAIKAAEKQLGFELFDRTSRRLVPTQEARILLADAEPLFLMHEQIKQTALQLKAGRKGELRIVASSELSESLMPQLLSRFAKSHPGLELSLETQRVENLLEYLEVGISDIGFAMRPTPRPNLEYVPLAELEVICVCHRDHPLGTLEFVTPTDLREAEIINVRGMASSLIEESFVKSAVNYSPSFHVRFMNIAGYCAEEGLGVTFMDELTAANTRYARLARIPFRPRTPITLYAIVSAEKLRQRLINDLIRDARGEINNRLSLIEKFKGGSGSSECRGH